MIGPLRSGDERGFERRSLRVLVPQVRRESIAMARSIHIPGIADITTVDDKAEVRALAAAGNLDRGCRLPGSLVNRLMMGHVARTLRVNGEPLPAVAPRDHPQRAARQAALRARLDPATPLWDDATLAALVAAVRGTKGADAIGPATQQAIGRVFDTDYIADAASWQAALDLDGALRRPVRGFFLKITGRLGRSRDLLSRKVRGDLAAVHATGIAVHNLVRGFETMRELWRRQPRPSADEAVRQCLFAPETVLRQATARGTTEAGDVRSGTVVRFRLDDIRARHPGDPEVVFMAGTWAECPAVAFVPALLRAVWEGALASRSAGRAS
jgi:hypothetical protein